MAHLIQKDRLAKLLASTTLNGIDFVEVAAPDQKTLRVHFLNSVVVQGTMPAGAPPTITGGESVPDVPVLPINDATDWGSDAEGRPVLTLRVPHPGDFSFYTLSITSTALDDFFSRSVFSFKALCPSNLDCEPEPPECPPADADVPPIDYLAKDFLSFRKALSDFSALRYPEWQERSEADFGMMFMEALSSVADDLSYFQDAVAAEATLETATQRRSVVRHARLVDYEPRAATASRVLLQFDVPAGSAPVPAGYLVSAQGPDGALIAFEAGTGLNDTTSYVVSNAWNRGIKPYYWDDSQRCVEAGATEMYVQGKDFGFEEGQMLLIDTEAQVSADPPVREVVRLVSFNEMFDPLFNIDVTRIVWRPEDALKFGHDISFDITGHSRTTLAGNLIPATQGRRYTESFAIDVAPASSPDMPLAVVRTGPRGYTAKAAPPLYLYTLSHAPVAWLAQDDPEQPPLPEVKLTQQGSAPLDWQWHRRLLTAEQFQGAFTLDASRLARVAENSDKTFAHDYDGDQGDTLRFGDGVFGTIPEEGTVFKATYRVGGGAAGNVAADSINRVDPAATPAGLLVTNPFPATGGADEETDESVRRLAPQAFRARQFRAVRPEDYDAAAERLSWVENSGTVFRWTGSWLTVFTTVDPRGSEEIPVNRHIELINLLNRYRMAGYEAYAPAPRFVSLDIVVKVCARTDAFRGDVEEAVLEALNNKRSIVDGSVGFFHPDNFTFGTPLERSSLEAAVQSAYGVAGVTSVLYRRRGLMPFFVPMPDTVRVREDVILRLSNDPSLPERGSLKIIVEGGK